MIFLGVSEVLETCSEGGETRPLIPLLCILCYVEAMFKGLWALTEKKQFDWEKKKRNQTEQQRKELE